MAPCVAGVLEGGAKRIVQSSSKKVGQSIKRQLSAKILVEVLLDRGPSIFESELDVVLVNLPREVIQQLIIGIHATARVAAGGAELRKIPNKDDWQALVRNAGSQIQPYGTRMESPIFGKKVFGKAIPAVT